MAPPLRRLLPLLSRVNASRDAEAPSLAQLARRAGLSPFHFQRIFSRALGESPKRYLLRQRLERAAAALLRGETSVLDVALEAGFDSHEGFTRAFHKAFGRSPRAYRARAALEPMAAQVHAALTARHGPCVALMGITLSEGEHRMPSYDIHREDLPAQPALVIRRRVARADIAKSLGELFGRVFGHIQRSGLPLAGAPFARYSEWGPAHVTMEAGFPLAKSAASQGDIAAVTVHGGPVARTVHQGPYEALSAAHQALEEWIVSQGATPGNSTIEAYVTDPGTVPNPADWKTEVYRSIAA